MQFIDMSDSILPIVKEIPSMTEAIRCCVRFGKLTDKQVYLELGIDGGQWNRMCNGTAYFPQEKFTELMRICRNNIPLAWLAQQSGYDLKLSRSSFEELLQQERDEKLDLKIKLDVILDILKKANIKI